MEPMEFFHHALSGIPAPIVRGVEGCVTNAAEAELFIDAAIEDAQRELAEDFGVNDPSTLAITVDDRTKYGRMGPALIWVFAEREGRTRWREIELWTEEWADAWRETIERVLRRYPAYDNDGRNQP